MTAETARGSSDRIEVIRAIMEAWGRHDIDAVLSHVADDVEWHYHVGSPPVQGRDNMRKLLDKLQHHQLQSRWRLVRHAEANDAVLIEAIDDYVNPAGNRVQAPYMGVYEFDGETVTAWRDYVDLGAMSKAEAGEPLPAWIDGLVDRGA
jgi:limonene-1,2-epoxide hydrolase